MRRSTAVLAALLLVACSGGTAQETGDGGSTESDATAAGLQLEPNGLVSPTYCQFDAGIRNIIFLSGDPDSWVHPGTETAVGGRWQEGPPPSPDFISLLTSNWSFEFSSEQLGQPLALKLYEDAQRAGLEEPGHPGLEINIDGKGCSFLTGRFQIHELAIDPDAGVQKLLVTFEQQCSPAGDIYPGLLRGCVNYHYWQPTW